MKLKELIEMYENELKEIKEEYNVDNIRDIQNVHSRTLAFSIQRFIGNLENLMVQKIP